MKIRVILPTLFPKLAERALTALRQHGCGDGVSVRFVVVSDTTPDGDDIDFVYEETPRGIYPAIRAGVERCEPDSIVHVTCDDVIYNPGWLNAALDAFLFHDRKQQNKNYIMGLRHAGGIGTCYGHMYANFPMFRKTLLDDSYIAENFMAPYLRAQWGDVALGLATWYAGGVVRDSGTDILLGWADRMGLPEALHKHSTHEQDMVEIQNRFGPAFGQGWPETYRGFNIDCAPSMLTDGTIRVPSYTHFTMEYGRNYYDTQRRFG